VIGFGRVGSPILLSGEEGARRSFDWGAFSISAFADGAYVANVEGERPIRS
jgi:hypothetical protein